MIQKIRDSVGYLIVLTVIAQFISFIRESIFAYFYGTSYRADAYVMASQIPIALFAVVTTSINTVILPIYVRKKENEGQKSADKFMNSFILVFELLCLGLTILSCIFARYIVHVFAPAFKGELLSLTIRYARLLFPTIMFSSLINILTVRFNVYKKFSYPQYIGLVQNLAICVAMVMLAHRIDTDAAVIGTIVGIILNTVLLVFPCRRVFVEKPKIKGLWKEIKEVLYKVVPVACGIGVAEINRVIDRAIASGLDTGSITGLNYANKLAVVFSALIVTALSTICFQKFSTMFVKGLYSEQFEELKKYLLVLLYVLLPITCGAIILRKQLITFVFARGAFGLESVRKTSEIFLFYAIGILPIAAREILTKYYYASENTKIPMINSVVGVIINIILNVWLAKYMGASGLALATTISYYVVCVLLFISIIRKQNKGHSKIFFRDCIPAVLASIFMSISVTYIIKALEIRSSLFSLLAGMAIGMIIYLGICVLVGKKQLKNIFKTLFGRI